MTGRAAPSTDVDSVHMRRALALARLGWGQTAPNPMVGAVVVSDGDVVGEGYHARYGEPHAEVRALERAGTRARGATVYVSLEPCSHFGKTAPCADALIAAGVGRVVVAAPDPSPVASGGAERLREAGIQVDMNVERAAALELNAAFFNAIVSPRPWVTLKLALSADGGIGDPSGEHRWITGVESRAAVHRLRTNADAIAVGVGTVLADDPSLTVRDAPAPRVPPKRIVFDSSVRIPPDSALISTAREIETIVVCRTDVDAVAADRVARVAAAGGTIMSASSLSDALERLRQRDIRALFVEGGARLAGSFLRESLVDRLIIFRAELELGPDALHAFAFAPEAFEASLGDEQHRVVEERRFGDDTMTVYALHEVPCSPG